MPTADKEALLARLKPFGQEHLLRFWDALPDQGRQRLSRQIEQLDLQLVDSQFRGGSDTPDWAVLAARAEPPRAISLADPVATTNRASTIERTRALGAGEVGMILVAGGQGSRLGFDHPKGMFPIGPVSGRSLFQILIDRLRAVAARYRVSIPLYLMTSPATHEETLRYVQQEKQFGLGSDGLRIFCQGVMPAVDASSGKLLLADHDQLLLSPDGHGGMLKALQQSGCLEDASRRGIRHFFYGQVDNPLLQVCDPFFLGCHLNAGAEVTTQVVRKTAPEERVGNVVEVDGRARIIEYSDLPADVAAQRDADGALRLWAGNLAVHVFDRMFLERMAEQSEHLPLHRALKRASYVNADGTLETPGSPNAVKFERFIFDLLPAATTTLVVEVDKHDGFAPVKNAEGAPSDTPATAKQALVRRDTKLLRAAGAEVAPGVEVEVNPLWALDAEEASQKLSPGTKIDQATYFSGDSRPV